MFNLWFWKNTFLKSPHWDAHKKETSRASCFPSVLFTISVIPICYSGFPSIQYKFDIFLFFLCIFHFFLCAHTCVFVVDACIHTCAGSFTCSGVCRGQRKISIRLPQLLFTIFFKDLVSLWTWNPLFLAKLTGQKGPGTCLGSSNAGLIDLYLHILKNITAQNMDLYPLSNLSGPS